MNYELLKKKMDKYFAEASVETLVKGLQDAGYVFSSVQTVLPFEQACQIVEKQLSFIEIQELRAMPYSGSPAEDDTYTKAA